MFAGVRPPGRRVAARHRRRDGTSYGNRDAWSVGYDGRHVLGVWVAVPTSGSVPGISGYEPQRQSCSKVSSAPVSPPCRFAGRRPVRPAPPMATCPVTLERFVSGAGRTRPRLVRDEWSPPPRIIFPPTEPRRTWSRLYRPNPAGAQLQAVARRSAGSPRQAAGRHRAPPRGYLAARRRRLFDAHRHRRRRPRRQRQGIRGVRLLGSRWDRHEAAFPNASDLTAAVAQATRSPARAPPREADFASNFGLSLAFQSVCAKGGERWYKIPALPGSDEEFCS